ncbi:MAG: hypothetical protein BV457_08070 [Thermoplasmata archaeon M9B1D]|nr:MAG: hypothetical protein BV457_08070 [Thermoplasmata archaeon M9B1D]PNX48970.1 MAG: hypothetical protein BV456_09315 [Thermoplasmata archaeon M8B2D]
MRNKKNCIIGLVGLFVLMMTAASVCADEDEPGILDRAESGSDELVDNPTDDSSPSDEEPNLISPSPNDDLGPLIIAPMDETSSQDESSEDNNITIVFVAGIVGFVTLATALIIIKKKY